MPRSSESSSEEFSIRTCSGLKQAYTLSVSAVAGNHIRYIVDRIQLFLDLEELEVDDLKFTLRDGTEGGGHRLVMHSLLTAPNTSGVIFGNGI